MTNISAAFKAYTATSKEKMLVTELTRLVRCRLYNNPDKLKAAEATPAERANAALADALLEETAAKGTKDAQQALISAELERLTSQGYLADDHQR